MGEFLITIDKKFVRDTQIAPNDLIKDYIRSADDVKDENEYAWRDFFGEIVVGMFSGNNSKEVIERVSKDYEIDKVILKAYKLA